MPKIASEELVAQWRRIVDRFPREVRVKVHDTAYAHQTSLASYFYERMLDDPAAARYLSHEQVKTRLHASMMRWITTLFSDHADDELRALVAHQIQIGDVHARIDLPIYLVLNGARHLKYQLTELLLADADGSGEQKISSLRMMNALVDIAMEVMSQAYSTSYDRNSRAAEAYRLFSVVQDAATERERQRAAVLDWENAFMYEAAMGQGAEHLPRIAGSEFGLWFRHKGAHAFQNTPETEQIIEAMEYIDSVLLPLFDMPAGDETDSRMTRLRDVRDAAKGIAFHLDALFQQNSELEAGRDVLTRLLNRKFLPVVMTKEIAYARDRGAQFAAVAVDVDHFKQINDSYGHEAGDMVLQQLAVLLSNSSRGGDYIFRLGGEEFLLLIVDVDAAKARKAAEKLRRLVEHEVFRLPHERTLSVTISVGVALYDGHPDYSRILKSADDALYQAKHSGRNLVVMAN